tara:strand:- start:69 stop:518 length:450 start_codon:yes stop_codon:yes gene_type:complete
MGLFDMFTSNKGSRKRTHKQIRYDRILTKQQEQILESQEAVIQALKMECKSLRQVLFSQDELYQELGIEPLPINSNQAQPVQSGEFNTSDLLASITKGLNADKVPGGRIALDAFSTFLQSNSQEVNALGSHYIKQAMPKQEIKAEGINQ